MAPKTIDKAQLSLFDAAAYVAQEQEAVAPEPSQEGAHDCDTQIRGLISAALKRCPMSRHHVAARMSELAAQEITKSQIDSWSAESRADHRFPLAFLPAFVEATGDRSIIRFLCQRHGMTAIEGRDTLRLELGRAEFEKREASKRERAIRDLLSTMS